jgi:hypothetical protein
MRALLARSAGYAVFDRRGRRVGVLIGLVGAESEQVAIRHEQLFFAHRRMLPSSVVAAVLPADRAVMLNVDRRELEKVVFAAAAKESAEPEETESATSENWHDRIGRYVAAGENKHLLFVSTLDGYKLIERSGDSPEPLQEVELDDELFRVVKLATSPLPKDRRLCAYLEPADRLAHHSFD